MDTSALLEGLLFYLCFIPVLTFHEFAHAWTSWKCGDDTAKDLGRVSLNPIVHMELVGTVILPLLAIYFSVMNPAVAGFIIGWGKPVPVNLNNLRNPRRDDTLIALAGPGMNLILAFLCMAIAKIGFVMKASGNAQVGEILITTGVLLVQVNLVLAFFNLLPIPPLDGSHVLWNALRLSYELYFRIMPYGIIIVILVLNYTSVRHYLGQAVSISMYWLLQLYRVTGG
jgi:Zn-dependent protease